MPKWNVLTQTVTGGKEDPREFAVHGSWEDGGTFIENPYRDKWFVIAAERERGGDDSTTPRRALGIGDTRASARRSLIACISRYDHRPIVVYPRERAAERDA